MAGIIDGRASAARLRAAIGAQVRVLRESHHIVPGLAVILVGDDPASQIYVRHKGIQAREAGIRSIEHRLSANATQDELRALVAQLNGDSAVNGILVQLPLPRQIDSKAILSAIDPKKDVDGFHPSNVGALATDENALAPCTPLGCLILLKAEVGQLAGLRAVVLGRSNIVGKPMAMLLLREDCTVTIAHSKTRDLAEECRRGDIVVAAVGRPAIVKGTWIKPGAIVIDVGINRVATKDGKSRLVGDVDFPSASRVAAAITPVPGGVGPMTIACLLDNTVTATCRQYGIERPR